MKQDLGEDVRKRENLPSRTYKNMFIYCYCFSSTFIVKCKSRVRSERYLVFMLCLFLENIEERYV